MLICAHNWGIQPGEFWNMTPGEWFALFYHYQDQQRGRVTSLTRAEADDLYEWAMARKAELENGAA